MFALDSVHSTVRKRSQLTQQIHCGGMQEDKEEMLILAML